MKPLNCYAIKNPQGEIMVDTISPTFSSSMNKYRMGERYFSNYQELGYICVPCTVSEVREESDIKDLILRYRDEKMPHYASPYHHQAEGWATLESFIEWFHSLNNGNND